MVWQALAVHYNYAGNWTGPFYTGALSRPVPPALEPENVYRFQNSYGYDGQVYHYIAHDPFLRRGFSASVDAPRIRYRRILVPLFAYLLAAGEDTAIDAAYLVVVWAFLLLGTYWLAHFAVRQGYPASMGALFALAPAVLVSIDRLTVDIALAACCAGFALYAEEQSRGKLYVILALAPLARETGILLTCAYLMYLGWKRQLRDAALFATTLLPAAGWFAFVQTHTGTPIAPPLITPLLFTGIAMRIVHPYHYDLPGLVTVVATILDLLAVAGVLGALVWTLYRLARRVWSPVVIAAGLFALLAAAMPQGELWSEVYAFGRTLTPLLLLAAMDGLAVRSLWPAAAMLALDPRVGLQMGREVLNVVHGLLR